MLGVNWATAVNRGLSLKGSGTSWQQKNIFRENHSKKKLRETQKFNFYFRAFLLVLGKVLLCQEDCVLIYNSSRFRDFPNFY